MLLIPFELPASASRGPVVLVMILEKENLDRMRRADPYDLLLRVIPKLPVERRLRDLDLVIAYEEDTNTIMDFNQRQDIAGLLQWLERGRAIQVGDCTPITPLRRN